MRPKTSRYLVKGELRLSPCGDELCLNRCQLEKCNISFPSPSGEKLHLQNDKIFSRTNNIVPSRGYIAPTYEVAQIDLSIFLAGWFVLEMEMIMTGEAELPSPYGDWAYFHFYVKID